MHSTAVLVVAELSCAILVLLLLDTLIGWWWQLTNYGSFKLELDDGFEEPGKLAKAGVICILVFLTLTNVAKSFNMIYLI